MPGAAGAAGAGAAGAPLGMMAKMKAAAPGLVKSAAEGAVGIGVTQALTPKQPQYAQTQSMGVRAPQQASQGIYQQAAINTQNRMNRRGQPRRFI